MPREKDFIEKNKTVEKKVPQLDEMQESWGANYRVVTLDFKGEFDLTDGDQIYVLVMGTASQAPGWCSGAMKRMKRTGYQPRLSLSTRRKDFRPSISRDQLQTLGPSPRRNQDRASQSRSILVTAVRAVTTRLPTGSLGLSIGLRMHRRYL